MSQNKESTVNASSLIDLKAELFRKQEEFKRQKLQSQNAAFIKGKPSTSEKKKPNIWSKKNAGVTQRAARDYEEKLEEEDIFEKSKKSLENKAKLYEKISSGNEVPEEDGSGLFLVDFQKKVIDGVLEKRDRAREEEEERQRREIEEEKQQLQEPVPEPENEDEEWVDFVDSFGRSRRCLKKDLPDLQRQDEDLKERKERKKAAMEALAKDFDSLRDKSDSYGATLMSDDMRRGIARQEWEKQELETMEAEKSGPVHYSDVRHNEIRSHGVGFYEFDKDETVRQEQMQELNKLREQTVTERSKKDRIKEKRKAALEARLAKVKQRRKLKTGDQEVEEESENKSDEEIGPKVEEKSDMTADDTADNKPADLEKLQKPVAKIREWDIGKERLLERSEASWLEKQRAERFEEFAPPKEYYENPRPVQQNPRPLQKTWGQGNKSVFSKITKIKLATKPPEKSQDSSDDQGISIGDQPSCDPDRVTKYNSENISENEMMVNQTDGGSDTGDLVVEGQNTEFPVGFDPAVPPPSFMQQTSWFAQQQTGTVFSATASQGFSNPQNQSMGTSYCQMSQPSESAYQNVIKWNSVQTITEPASTLGAAQGMLGVQNGSGNVSYPHTCTTGLQPIIPVTASSPQSGFGASPGFNQYTNSFPTDYVECSQRPTQTVTGVGQKTVIPKMKIIDTRLMQNDGD